MTTARHGERRASSLSAAAIIAAATVFLALAVGTADSYSVLKGNGGDASPSSRLIKYHDMNSVKLAVSNTGQIGIDIFANNGAGFWPVTTPNNYVYGTGIWIGGIADVDGDGDEDELFVEAYDPLSGGTEYQEGYYGQSKDDPLATVFRSSDPEDLENWPAQFSDSLGNPVVMSDQDLVTIYNTVGKTPIFMTPSPPLEVRQRSLAFTAGLAGQVIIFIFDIENISERESSGPYALEEAYFGFDSDMDIGAEFGDDRTSLFRKQDNLATPEPGDSIAVNMAFAWDEDFSESNFVGDPGFVGIAYLQSPGNDEDGIDNDVDGMVDESPFNGIDDDGDGVIDDQPDEVDQLGLVNYSFHCSPSSCESRPDVQSDPEGYRVMSCDPPDECVEVTEATDVRFMFSSGPFRMRPGETHRLVLAFVFAHAMGDPTGIEVYGDPPRPDPNDPVFGEFLAAKQTVQGIYDLGFQRSSPPPRAGLTFLPGDGQVTVLWDSSPLTTPDPNYEDFFPLDPDYRQYDFEGFRLWRSRTGMFSTAGDPDDPLNPLAQLENEAREDLDLTLLGQWDLANGITTIPDGIMVTDSLVDEDGDIVVISADTFDLGTDTGLRFSYIDRGDEGLPLLNGYRYFYSLESYDYNSTALPVSRLSTRNGISFPPESSVIPSRRTDDLEVSSEVSHVDSGGDILEDDTPVEFDFDEPPKATDALRSSSVSTLLDADVADTWHELVVDDVVPLEDDSTSLMLYHVEDASGRKLHTGGDALSHFAVAYDSLLIAALVTVFDPGDTTVPLYELTMDLFADRRAYHNPEVRALTAVDASGSDITGQLGSVTVPGNAFNPRGFRGADLTITWHQVGPDTLTVDVYDTGNRVPVPFMEADDPNGQNWAFESPPGQWAGQYLTGQPTLLRLYVSGVAILCVGFPRLPQEGDVWTLRQRSWYVSAEGDTIPASRPLVPGTRYRLAFSPAQDITAPEFTIGVFQNTILTNDLDIYVVASEEMDTVPALSVAGTGAPLTPVASEEVELYSAAYRLTQSGTYTVEVRGKDTWGNEGDASEEFSAGLILRSAGGTLASVDRVLRLDVPPGAVREESRYFLCMSEDSEEGIVDSGLRRNDHPLFLPRTGDLPGIPTIINDRHSRESGNPVLSGSLKRPYGVRHDDIPEQRTRMTPAEGESGDDAVLAVDAGIAVSPVYLLSPPGEQLEKTAQLSFSPRAMDLAQTDPAELGIYSWTGGGWTELASRFDPVSHSIEATIGVLGSYQLRSRGPHGTSPLPRVYRLAQNFPNPFNPSTTIGFDIPEEEGEVRTELSIYSVRGQRVRTLLEEMKAPGSYSVVWDGRGEEGRVLGSGIYFYRIEAGEFVSVKKMVLVK